MTQRGVRFMKKVKILTPENIEIEYTLADLGSRVAASVIDFMIIFGVLLLLIIIPLIIVYNNLEYLNKYTGWIVGISLIVFALVYYGYFIFLEITMNGRTIGKKFLKIRAIRSNGQPITLKHSVIRNLFKILIDISGVGVVLIYFNKEHKRLGDILASTIVVMEDKIDVPVNLTSIIAISTSYDSLTIDEVQLLEDYFNRQSSFDDKGNALGKQLWDYFSQKNVPQENAKDYERLLVELNRKLSI